MWFPEEDSWFPCTNDYFYPAKNKHDGLSPTCKRCDISRGSKNWNEDINGFRDRNKKCSKDRYDNIPENKEKKLKQSQQRRLDGKHAEWLKTPAGKESGRKAWEKRKHKNHKINKKEWVACKDYFKNEDGEWCCAYCGALWKDHYRVYAGKLVKSDLHKEHADDEGSNDLSNCIPSCLSCNTSKHKYTLEFWYSSDNPNFSQERLNKINKWLDEDWKLYYIEKKPRAVYGSRKKVS